MSEVQARALAPGDPALEREWRRLEDTGAVPSAFQTWSWFSTIKEHADAFGDLTVIAAVRDEVVIGLFAVEIVESRWHLRTLQSPGQDWIVPDHVDVIATEEHLSAAALSIADWILSHRHWDVLDLDGLTPDSPLAAALTDRRRRLTQFGQIMYAERCPQLRLEADRDPLESRSQSARKKIRRDLNRLDTIGGQSSEISECAVDSRTAMKFTMKIARERFGTNAALFNSDKRRVFMEDLVERLRTTGELRWFTTRLEDQLLAADGILTHNGRFHTYMGVRSDKGPIESPGTVNLLTILRTAAAEGRLEVDLLRGDHPWKERVSTGEIVDIRVRIARARARTAFEFAARKLALRFRELKDRGRGSHPSFRSRVDSAIERRLLDVQRARVLTRSLESETLEPPSPPKEVRITRHVGGESDEVEWRAAFGSKQLDASREQRLRGDTCYAVWTGKSLASYLWVSTTPHRDPYSGTHLNLRDREAYIYDVRTMDDAQRQGFARLLLKHALAEMDSEVLTVHAVVDNWNEASMRLFESLNFVPSGSVATARILGRYAIQIPKTAKPETCLSNSARPMSQPAVARNSPA